jgi:hypothetical protein
MGSLKRNICVTNEHKSVCRYQRGNQNPETEKDRQHNGQKDKQRSTKHTHKAKDRVTRTPLKQEGRGGAQVLRKGKQFLFN